MADYVVSTAYVVEDRSSGPMRAISSNADTLATRLGTAKSAALKLGAAVAGAFALRGAWSLAQRHLIGYNEQITQTRIGLAALLSTSADFGKISGPEKFAKSMQMAPEILETLRKTAASGLGTLQDYLGGFNLLLNPILKGNGNLKDVLDMTRLLVPVSQTLRLPMEVATRDIVQMMQGRSTNMDQLPKYLGMTSQEINRLAKSKPAELLKRIKTELQKWDPAAAEFGKTLGAQTDTLKDAVANILGKVGKPLTEELSKAVLRVNSLLDGSRTRIDQLAEQIGKKLGGAVQGAVDAGITGGSFLVQNWDRLVDVSTRILKIWVAIKLAQKATAIWGAAAGMARAAGGIGNLSLLGARLGGAAIPAALATQMRLPAGAGSFMLAPAMMHRAAEVHFGVGRQLYTMFNPLQMGVAALGNAMMVATAALAGWQLGSLIDETFGLSDKLSEAGYKLERWLKHKLRGDKSLDQEELEVRAASESVAMRGTAAWLANRRRQLSYGNGGWGMDAVDALERATKTGTAGMSQREMDALREEATGLMEAAFRGKAGIAEYAGDSKADQTQFAMAIRNVAKFGKLWGMDAERLGEAVKIANQIAPVPAGTVDLGQEGIKGAASKVNVDMRGSRFEVKVDARDKDPDDIATVFWDEIWRASEFKVRSGVTPALSL